jgi:ribose/xylose/arabinose/galactoside ABC-type transport system permease subunit
MVNAFGMTRVGIPSFIMTLAMFQIAAGISALLVRGQMAYAVPPLIMTLGSRSLGPIPWIVIVAALFLLVGYGDRDYRVGLTFVILCAEIDLSVASISNPTGIVVGISRSMMRAYRERAFLLRPRQKPHLSDLKTTILFARATQIRIGRRNDPNSAGMRLP